MHVLEPPDLKYDEYRQLTVKVLSTFKYVHEIAGDYDWYLKADDDTFVFVDHLREFVADKQAWAPVTYGYDFSVILERGYHSGGGGYLLSNEALSRLGSSLRTNSSFCQNTGTEDVDVARCLHKLHVFSNKSIDEAGRERFHPLSLTAHYKGHFPGWLVQYAANPLRNVSRKLYILPSSLGQSVLMANSFRERMFYV